MRRRMLCFVAVLVVVCALPSVAAEESFLYLENTDGTLTIIGYNGFLSDLEVPAEIDGKTVTAVGDSAFMHRVELYTVTLPDTVKTVGRQAFSGCGRLTSVALSQVETLGEEAFAECTELREIDLGSGLTAIGKGAFEGCMLLGEVSIPATVTEIGVDAFLGCEQVRLSVGENAYAREWAEANNIPLSFWESDSLILLLVVVVSAAGAMLLWSVWKQIRKRRKAKKQA